MSTELITRLRNLDVASEIAAPPGDGAAENLGDWRAAGLGFVASDDRLEKRYYRAVNELFAAIRPTGGFGTILNEGGVYDGAWLESTGTISAEVLSRFLPQVAERTFAGFAQSQREDGLLPFMLGPDGPAFNQIQFVSPLARSVWNHYLLNGRDKTFLATLYKVMVDYDAWLVKNRNTRGTGAVEAFGCYDTGHDLSARFWHMPDTPFANDPAKYDASNPLLPLIAPDLTAAVSAQRKYLARIAEELGEDGTKWADMSQASIVALYSQCFDGYDRFFYDRDKSGRQIKVQSDVLLRVLACEVGNDAFFAESLEHYLLNTSKFFPKFPFSSIALTDPRFDAASDHNSWNGPTNFLSLLWAPHAFEAHHRHVELTFAIYPAIWALMSADRFPQTLNPFTGAPGFTEGYSPATLTLIDFIERLSGIVPRPDETVWFTGLTPIAVQHEHKTIETGYARAIDGLRFELVNAAETSVVYRDGVELYRFPRGLRLVTDRLGAPLSLIGMTPATVTGLFVGPEGDLKLSVGPNEQLDFVGGRLVKARPAGFVPIGF